METDRERLIALLKVPIYPLESADPTEVVADYLLDNDVRPVTMCRDCLYAEERTKRYVEGTILCACPDLMHDGDLVPMWENDFCSYGEKKNGEVQE